MNSLWDIRIFLGLVPKESPGIISVVRVHVVGREQDVTPEDC